MQKSSWVQALPQGMAHSHPRLNTQNWHMNLGVCPTDMSGIGTCTSAPCNVRKKTIRAYSYAHNTALTVVMSNAISICTQFPYFQWYWSHSTDTMVQNSVSAWLWSSLAYILLLT